MSFLHSFSSGDSFSKMSTAATAGADNYSKMAPSAVAVDTYTKMSSGGDYSKMAVENYSKMATQNDPGIWSQSNGASAAAAVNAVAAYQAYNPFHNNVPPGDVFAQQGYSNSANKYWV